MTNALRARGMTRKKNVMTGTRDDGNNVILRPERKRRVAGTTSCGAPGYKK